MVASMLVTSLWIDMDIERGKLGAEGTEDQGVGGVTMTSSTGAAAKACNQAAIPAP
jgi:hypothetical protein